MHGDRNEVSHGPFGTAPAAIDSARFMVIDGFCIMNDNVVGTTNNHKSVDNPLRQSNMLDDMINEYYKPVDTDNESFGSRQTEWIEVVNPPSKGMRQKKTVRVNKFSLKSFLVR